MWWCKSEVLEEESWVTRGHSIAEDMVQKTHRHLTLVPKLGNV